MLTPPPLADGVPSARAVVPGCFRNVGKSAAARHRIICRIPVGSRAFRELSPSHAGYLGNVGGRVHGQSGISPFVAVGTATIAGGIHPRDALRNALPGQNSERLTHRGGECPARKAHSWNSLRAPGSGRSRTAIEFITSCRVDIEDRRVLRHRTGPFDIQIRFGKFIVVSAIEYSRIG